MPCRPVACGLEAASPYAESSRTARGRLRPGCWRKHGMVISNRVHMQEARLCHHQPHLNAHRHAAYPRAAYFLRLPPPRADFSSS